MKSGRIRMVAAASLLFAALSCAQGQHAQEPNAQQLFTEGKKLIEKNCSECMGATRHDFERGIAKVRKAIDAGYVDHVAAYKLLADAYNDLAYVYARRDPKEQEGILLLRRDALKKLLELKPNDPRVRAEYASVIEDKEMGIAAWRDVVAQEPNDAEARLILGVNLIQKGQTDEGMSHLRRMVELANLYWGRFYVESAQRALIEKGKKAEAEQIRKLMERKIAAYLIPIQTIKQLSKLQPGEGRMRAELAKVVKDPKNRIPQLQDILAGNALHRQAMFSLGMVLLFDHQYDQGVVYMKRLLESTTPPRVQTYGRIAEKFLIEEGKKAEAAEVAKLIADKNKRSKPN